MPVAVKEEVEEVRWQSRFFIEQTLRKNNKVNSNNSVQHNSGNTALASVARILYGNKRNQQIHANRIF